MKIKALLYCVKAKPYLVKCGINTEQTTNNTQSKYATFNFNVPKNLNGKIVAECDFDVEKIKKVNYDCMLFTNTLDTEELINKSCVDYFKLEEYLKPNWDKEDNLQNLDTVGKAIHIKNLKIFDKPKELKDFDQVNNCCFEKEVDKDWEGLPIYACVFTNCCRYQSDGHTCDKHYFPLKHIKGMSKVWDNLDCKWKYVIAVSPQEMCRIANKEQTILVRKKVLKEML